MTAGGSFLDKLLLGIKEVEWNGGAITFRPTINFLGGTVADNAGNDSTDVTLGSGGGGFTPGGDLSGTSTSQSVVGIRGNAIPSLSTGVLQWTGSVWSFATTASIFTPGGDLTGTATSQEVTGLLTHALPSLVSGYLQWTGSAWAFTTPTLIVQNTGAPITQRAILDLNDLTYVDDAGGGRMRFFASAGAPMTGSSFTLSNAQPWGEIVGGGTYTLPASPVAGLEFVLTDVSGTTSVNPASLSGNGSNVTDPQTYTPIATASLRNSFKSFRFRHNGSLYRCTGVS